MLITTPITFDGPRAPVTFQGQLGALDAASKEALAKKISYILSPQATFSNTEVRDIFLLVPDNERDDVANRAIALGAGSVAVLKSLQLARELERQPGAPADHSKKLIIAGVVVGIALVGGLAYYFTRK